MGLKTMISCTSALMLLSGVALAQSSGETSGTAAGGNIKPSTAVQSNKSSAAGAPGVAGAPGSKNGPAETSPKKKTPDKMSTPE